MSLFFKYLNINLLFNIVLIYVLIYNTNQIKIPPLNLLKKYIIL